MSNVELSNEEIQNILNIMDNAQYQGWKSGVAIGALGVKLQLAMQPQNGQVAPETEEEVKAGR